MTKWIFICPRCGEVSETYTIQKGGYHIDINGLWDDIKFFRYCAACHSSVKPKVDPSLRIDPNEPAPF